MSVPHPPINGRSRPLQSWANYIQSRQLLVDAIDWKRPSLLSSTAMHTRVSVKVGPNYRLGSSTTANGGTHPPICGWLAYLYAGKRTWAHRLPHGPRICSCTAILLFFKFCVHFRSLRSNIWHLQMKNEKLTQYQRAKK